MTDERDPGSASPADDDLGDLTDAEREERARIIAFLADGRVSGVPARSLGMSRRTLIQEIDRYRIPRPRAPDRPNR